MGYSAEEIEVRVQREQGKLVRAARLDRNARRSCGLSPTGHYGRLQKLGFCASNREKCLSLRMT